MAKVHLKIIVCLVKNLRFSDHKEEENKVWLQGI